MNELLPCPFCGWGDPSWHVEHFAYDFEEYAVHCGNCDAESAMLRTREEAAAAWNRRTTLPTAPAPDWSSAPEWATHHVYNCMGSGLWINGEAKVDTTWASGWRRVLRQTMDGHTDYSGYQLPLGVDWRETLTARPTEDK